jgi:lariat debranching enzyme
MLSKRIDIFLSHDWPTGIWNYGDCDRLLATKPFFRDEIHANSMGSPPLMDLLNNLQPRFWFSAHLHVKFPAVVVHPSSASEGGNTPDQTTKFLALDKVLPGRSSWNTNRTHLSDRDFLQIVPVECQVEEMEMSLHYDLEWLAILRRTHNYLSTSSRKIMLPTVLDPITETVDYTDWSPCRSSSFLEGNKWHQRKSHLQIWEFKDP